MGRNCKWHNGTHTDWNCNEVWSEGDVIGCAIDIEAGQMYFARNGTWETAPVFCFAGNNLAFFPAVSMRGNFKFNFTEEAFRFRPPHDNVFQPLLRAGGGADSDLAALMVVASGSFSRPT